MKFKITDGQNRIGIGISEVGDYFRFDEPLVISWADYRGSIGRYFTFLPSEIDNTRELRDKLQIDMYKDYSFDINELYSNLKAILELFKNGEYELKYYSSETKEFFAYYFGKNQKQVNYESFEVLFASKDINTKNKKLFTHKYSNFFYSKNIMDRSTACMYPIGIQFYATQEESKIDKKRVAYFISRIKNGERPFVIVCDLVYEREDYFSSFYILDGHHKLLAYQVLNIYPAIVSITSLPSEDRELEFDMENLSHKLYPWQAEHMIRHWEYNQTYKKYLKNSDSNIHQVLRNVNLKKEFFYCIDNWNGVLVQIEKTISKYKEQRGTYQDALRILAEVRYWRNGDLKRIKEIVNILNKVYKGI